MKIKKKSLVYRLYSFTFWFFENGEGPIGNKERRGASDKTSICRFVPRLIFLVPFSTILLLTFIAGFTVGIPAFVYFVLWPEISNGPGIVAWAIQEVIYSFYIHRMIILNIWAVIGAVFLLGLAHIKFSNTEIAKLTKAYIRAKKEKLCFEIEFVD